jgi:hypothetical protein
MIPFERDLYADMVRMYLEEKMKNKE